MKAVGRNLAVVGLVGLLALTGCSRSSNATTARKATTPTRGAADFGTMKNVCGKATGKNKASARGVTATAINVGAISDAGFVGSPGLDQELWDASDVFTRWCNAQGGINGRLINAQHLDAALTQFKQEVLVGCQSDFALVGGGAVFDDTGQQARLGCLLPNFPAFVTSGEARGSSLQYQQLPAERNFINVGAELWMNQKFPGSGNKVEYLAPNVASVINTMNQVEEASRHNGWKTLAKVQYPAAGQVTWIPIAQKLKTEGATGVVWLGEPQNLAKLEAAMVAIDYKPAWVYAYGGNIYDKAFLRSAKTQMVPTYVPLQVYPFELADKNAAGSEAMKQYLALFQKYLPNGKARTLLGVESFSEWLLFAKAAKACGADLTTRCLYDKMQTITTFDGGGLTAPSNPAGHQTSRCYDLVQATPNGFVVQDVNANSTVYQCAAANVVRLKGYYGSGVHLGDVGKTLADVK